MLLFNRLRLSRFLHEQVGQLSLMHCYLVDRLILGVIPERDLIVFHIELRLVRTLRVQLQATFLAQGGFTGSLRLSSTDLEVGTRSGSHLIQFAVQPLRRG